MPATSKVVINLATGLEDGERVTVALLVGGAALEQGKQVTMPDQGSRSRRSARIRRWNRLRRLSAARTAARAVRSRRRTAAGLPDLFQRPQAVRERDRR